MVRAAPVLPQPPIGNDPIPIPEAYLRSHEASIVFPLQKVAAVFQ